MTTPKMTETPVAPDALLTVSEVGKILRVDDTTVRRWIKLGLLPAVILPHLNERQVYRILPSAVDKILAHPLIEGE